MTRTRARKSRMSVEIARLGATAWNHLALSVSQFYRWLDLGGHRSQHLVGTVPLRRQYRLAEVPCALSWEQVQRLPGGAQSRECVKVQIHVRLVEVSACQRDLGPVRVAGRCRHGPRTL